MVLLLLLLMTLDVLISFIGSGVSSRRSVALAVLLGVTKVAAMCFAAVRSIDE